MVAYCVAYLNFQSTEFLEEYGPKSETLIQKHGGETVTFGKPETLEGSVPFDDMVVIMKFPNAAAARSFYNDPAYAPLKALRMSQSETSLTVVEAVEV